MDLSDFMGAYFKEGLTCLFDTKDNNDARCDYSFLFLLGYVFSLFVLQLSLTYVSIPCLAQIFLATSASESTQLM